MSSAKPHAHQPGFGKRIACAVAGSILVVVGVVLLVLPGPGLLLVLAGLVVLSQGFPTVQRWVEPVRDRAIKGAEESVFTVATGLVLILAGVVWGLQPTVAGHALPFGGWATGSSFILSGLIVLALMVWSYRRVQQNRAREDRRTPAS